MGDISASFYVGDETDRSMTQQAFVEALYRNMTSMEWDGWIFYFGSGYSPLSVASWGDNESDALSQAEEFLRNSGRGEELGEPEGEEPSEDGYELYVKIIRGQDVIDYLNANMPVKSVEYRAKLQIVIDMLKELSDVTTGDEWDALVKDIYNTAEDDFSEYEYDLCDTTTMREVEDFVQDDLKDLYNLSLYENAEDENNLLPVIEATLPSVKKMTDRLTSLMNRVI